MFVPKANRTDKLCRKAEQVLLLDFAQMKTGYLLLHFLTGSIVEVHDAKFCEYITESKTHVSALIKGHHGKYFKIPFVALQVEYVAHERVRVLPQNLLQWSFPSITNAQED